MNDKRLLLTGSLFILFKRKEREGDAKLRKGIFNITVSLCDSLCYQKLSGTIYQSHITVFLIFENVMLAIAYCLLPIAYCLLPLPSCLLLSPILSLSLWILEKYLQEDFLFRAK